MRTPNPGRVASTHRGAADLPRSVVKTYVKNLKVRRPRCPFCGSLRVSSLVGGYWDSYRGRLCSNCYGEWEIEVDERVTGLKIVSKPRPAKMVEPAVPGSPLAEQGVGPPQRVAARYKDAYGMERGMGGLLFRMDRDGLYIQTMPSDPPYNQAYDATSMFGSRSGRLALRAAREIYETHKREIQGMKRFYEIHRFFEDKLKEARVRGKLKWHSWSMPD